MPVEPSHPKMPAGEQDCLTPLALSAPLTRELMSVFPSHLCVQLCVVCVCFPITA